MYYPHPAAVSHFQRKGNLTALKKDIKFTVRPQELYSALSNVECSIRKGGVYSANGPSFLLESCRSHPRTGRFSFAGGEPFLIFKSKGNNVQITENKCRGERPFAPTTITGNPINVFRSLLDKYKSIKIGGIKGFTGGAVGYFSYDCRHLFEKLPRRAKDDLNLPDMFFVFVDTVAAFDHIENKLSIISNIYPDRPLKQAYDEAVERIERLEERICRGGPCSCPNVGAIHELPLQMNRRRAGASSAPTNFQSTFTKQGFEAVVRRAKEYIAAGDIYQANLSQRFCVDIGAMDTLELYSRLSEINPSPFACYLDFGELKIASCSPERLLKLENGFVQTRPIAGTRPRGKTPTQDLELSCELILSAKERAEHIMLVDLERNDLGRACEYKSIRVDELMALEDYSHVIHIVSNVVGKLRPDKDRFDLIRAAFPGGTITGCPKIRCMEIIDELEPLTRNIYTGSIGYLDFNGDMDLNIAIRTFVIKDNKAYIQVGAGIVADSDPEREYYETLYKAEALFKALENQRLMTNDKIQMTK